jgi:two-component system response regulator LytT
MNCIIIEDSVNAVERLENQLELTGHELDIIARLDSVEEAVPWLKNNHTDLIFLDIQLGDGLGFEIFDHIQITTPVIFTTSYDHYLMRAFEVNSISYLLKPISLDGLKAALNKYALLYPGNTSINAQIAPLNRDYQERFLVKNGSLFQPIELKDMAFFYVENKRFLFAVTKSKQQYLYDSTLEILEQRLDPKKFFRINRQCIISFDMVQKVSVYDDGRRLKIEIDPGYKTEMIVSRQRVAEFKSWLNRL